MSTPNFLTQSPLGKKSPVVNTYTPGLLFKISRKTQREAIGVPEALPFQGCDIWNAYELSWLNLNGKPEVAMGAFRIPCDSMHLVESKSLKHYLNSFNQSQFSNREEVMEALKKDLSGATGSEVAVALSNVDQVEERGVSGWTGICIDHQDITAETYTVDPVFLKAGGRMVEESLYSNLLKSNCPITGQPDWGSVWFHYAGKQIDREGLLRYIISYREHGEFQESCVERMFLDILRRCQPEKLTVYARYTRRGGLDINPYRSNFEKDPENSRLARQ